MYPKEAKMDICFITDNAYSQLTRGAVNSIIENSGKNKITIHIICVDCSEENKNLFLEKATKNVNIDIIERNNYNPDVVAQSLTVHVSKSALLKFQLADIFPSLDTLLYLDGDIIVTGGLEELFSEDISDVYAGVVADMIAILTFNSNQRLHNKSYFNSGMMLLNLKKIREDNIVEKTIQAKKNDPWKIFMDQDALNVAFGDKVKYLHPTYNFMYINNYRYPKSVIAKIYNISEQEVEKVLDKAYIYHLTGKNKPTENLMQYKNEYWYFYADKMDYIQSLSRNLQVFNSHIFCTKRQINYIFDNFQYSRMKYCLFNFIPLLEWRRKKDKINVKVLGLNLLKITTDKRNLRVYFLGILFMKIRYKRSKICIA